MRHRSTNPGERLHVRDLLAAANRSGQAAGRTSLGEPLRAAMQHPPRRAQPAPVRVAAPQQRETYPAPKAGAS